MITEITPEVFEWQDANIIKLEMLTKDVLEMQIETKSPISIESGQYAMLGFVDQEGEFVRAYSIVDSTPNTLIFRIKIKEEGRAWRLLKTVKIWDVIKINKILWNFILKNTPNPKVFLATWTGIAPLYSMIINNSYSEDMYLFWGVRTRVDLFYIAKFNSIPKLQSYFFLSREENPSPYIAGRVDITDHNFSSDTEFYLCGNAPMVKEQVALLKQRWYKNIYIEIF
jgi:ferredoxin-NADP reductase